MKMNQQEKPLGKEEVEHDVEQLELVGLAEYSRGKESRRTRLSIRRRVRERSWKRGVPIRWSRSRLHLSLAQSSGCMSKKFRNRAEVK